MQSPEEYKHVRKHSRSIKLWVAFLGIGRGPDIYLQYTTGLHAQSSPSLCRQPTCSVTYPRGLRSSLTRTSIDRRGDTCGRFRIPWNAFGEIFATAGPFLLPFRGCSASTSGRGRSLPDVVLHDEERVGPARDACTQGTARHEQGPRW